MAVISAAESWEGSAWECGGCSDISYEGCTSGMRRSRTYGEVWGRGPGGGAGGIADDGLVDVAGANEAVAQTVRGDTSCLVGIVLVPLINVCCMQN